MFLASVSLLKHTCTYLNNCRKAFIACKKMYVMPFQLLRLKHKLLALFLQYFGSPINTCEACGSCVLKETVVECQSIALINLQSTSRLTLDPLPNHYLVSTLSISWLTLDQHLIHVNSWLSVHQLICIDWKLVDCGATVDQDAEWELDVQ